MRFRKKIRWAATRHPELSIEEQDCGTWYGCRWKPHQPTIEIVTGLWANRNRCAQCGMPIRYMGGDPDGLGGVWGLDLYIISEEEEV